MKVMKYELARAIDKLKSVVQKNEAFPALSGILVNNGYLIASNTEITIQVKLEAAAGESFIIPMKAFDLIKNLPEGEVTVQDDSKHVVTIQMEKIKNRYKSFAPDDFSYTPMDIETSGMAKLNGKRIMEALGHVVFAASDKDANKWMNGVYFDGKDDLLRVVALDGHVIAVDSMAAEGVAGMKLIVPKTAIKKLLSMGMDDDVELLYDDTQMVFRATDYSIHTRLVDGKYFAYEKMFGESRMVTIIDRKSLQGAMTRAKMCVEDNQPVIFDISGYDLNISIKDRMADYNETVELQEESAEEIRIGFSPKLVLEAAKAFTCDNISLSFSGPKRPMVIEAEDSDMKAVVLPVAIK
ncbi:MAG: DNA polymerase III subunit beta [Lachnospiraceae bacterium]|nr:DNA polymerase III subunit beta [Lachnospiraceae bacterium]